MSTNLGIWSTHQCANNMAFYEWKRAQSRMPSCYLEWPHVAKMAKIWLVQGIDSIWGQTGGETSPLGRTWISGAKPLWYQCNNSCGERWACLPVYVRAACKPLKVNRSPSIRKDYPLNSARPSSPNPSSTFHCSLALSHFAYDLLDGINTDYHHWLTTLHLSPVL